MIAASGPVGVLGAMKAAFGLRATFFFAAFFATFFAAFFGAAFLAFAGDFFAFFAFFIAISLSMKVEDSQRQRSPLKSSKERSRCVTRILSETTEEASVFRGKICFRASASACFQRETGVFSVRCMCNRLAHVYKMLSSPSQKGRYVV